MKLKAILDAITENEAKLIPVFIHNPLSQEIAGVAFVAEQALFSYLTRMHAVSPIAPVAAK